MPAKFDRCVRKVKSAGKVDNPYAICNASLKGKKMKETKNVELFKNKIIESFANMINELIGNQFKIDMNKNGKLDKGDFKKLRRKKKVSEMKVNKNIDRKEVRRMKAAGVSKEARREFTADDVARKTKDAEIKASMGPNNPKNTFKPKPKLNDKYIKRGRKGTAETPMSTEKINQSGVGGKPAAGRPGRTKADVLNTKLAKIDATSVDFMNKLAKNPKNSQK